MYDNLRDWASHALSQGDGQALYQLAAKEALELLKDKETWDTTAAWLLEKLEDVETESRRWWEKAESRAGELARLKNQPLLPPRPKDLICKDLISFGADPIENRIQRVQYLGPQEFFRTDI